MKLRIANNTKGRIYMVEASYEGGRSSTSTMSPPSSSLSPKMAAPAARLERRSSGPRGRGGRSGGGGEEEEEDAGLDGMGLSLSRVFMVVLYPLRISEDKMMMMKE